MSKVYVITECRIKKIAEDGLETDLDRDEVVAPIQMPGATWIKDLKISINQKEVYTSNQLYSYKVYFDTELSYSQIVKDGFLSITGYQKENKHDSVTDNGFITRKNMFAESKTVQLVSRLSTDITNQDLYLISNVEVDLEFTPQTNEFMITTRAVLPPAKETEYVFQITDVRLLVKTLDLMDGLSLEVARRLDIEPARYGIRKTYMKSLFISQGRTDFVANLFMDE